jgi:diguanylate cyclase (GGDEF)-like protein/PAS domain S-box-containing protein
MEWKNRMTSRKSSQTENWSQTSAQHVPDERAFRLLFTNHPIPMFVYDLKTLAILQVNEAMVETYGYSREEFQALTLKDIIPVEDITRLLDDVKKKRPALQHSVEWRNRLKNGQIIDVEVTSHTLEFEGHQAVLVMTQDITERKRAEEALSTSEAELRVLLAAMQDVVLVIDRDGAYRKIAPTNPNLLVKPSVELLGRNLRDVFPAVQAETFLASIRQVVDTQKPVHIEYELPIGERLVWFAVSISPMEADCTLWVARDITARKQAEDALRESEVHYRAVVEGTPVIVYSFSNKRGGMYYSEHVIDVLGYSPEQLYAQPMLWRNSIHPDDLPSLDQRNSIAVAGKTMRVEYRIKDAHGNWHWFDDRAFKYQNDDGEFIIEGRALDISERKQAETALRESEERYHILFDSMMDGIYRSTHAGKFVDVNPAMVKMFGYSSKEEMLAVDIKKELYFAPEERGSHILDTGQKEIEAYRMRRKDGSEIWVEDHGYYIHDEHGSPIYHEGMLRDITARRHAEEALLKLKKAVDTSTEAIFLTDLEGIFTYINPGFTALYGYSADEVIGKVTPRILKSGLLNPQIYVEHWKTLSSGQEVKEELINKRKNGKLIDVDVSATPILDDAKNIIGFLGIQHDITERKQAEEALRVAEANFRSIFENATVGIYQSTPQGRFLNVNPVMARTFGFDSPDDMLNSIINIEKQYYVDPETRHEFQRLMIEQGEALEFTSWNYRKNGERIWIQESARAVKDAQGNILYYEGFVSDITERKQAEDELRRAKNSLEIAHLKLQQSLSHEQVLARTDDLTGLCNRRQFFELAAREFTAAIRYQRPLSIIMFDADEFKQINDIFGHVEGDKALAQIAQIAAAQVRAVDVLARYGGDEFVLLLPQTDTQQALLIAERIRASVATTTHVGADQSPFTVTLSIGIAELQRSPVDEDVERVIQRADEALYAAKAEGRNRTVIFNSK